MVTSTNIRLKFEVSKNYSVIKDGVAYDPTEHRSVITQRDVADISQMVISYLKREGYRIDGVSVEVEIE